MRSKSQITEIPERKKWREEITNELMDEKISQSEDWRDRGI